MKKRIMNHESPIRGQGQALVTLLIFVAVASVIIAGSVAVTISNSRASGKYALGQQTLSLAESGAENAILRLLREPNTYSSETLTIDSGTVTITVSGTTTKTIISEASLNGFKRRVQVMGSFTNNVFTLSSWQEID